MARTFYRIVKADPPIEYDFWSHQARGLSPPNNKPATLYVWDGISVYDLEARARRKASDFPLLGSYIAAIRVEGDDPIRAERTTSSRGHYTLWGEPALMLARVSSVVPVTRSV